VHLGNLLVSCTDPEGRGILGLYKGEQLRLKPFYLNKEYKLHGKSLRGTREEVESWWSEGHKQGHRFRLIPSRDFIIRFRCLFFLTKFIVIPPSFIFHFLQFCNSLCLITFLTTSFTRYHNFIFLL
jgi:hypothetical protein